MTTKDIEFEGASLKIKEFKMKYIQKDAAIVMIAKRGSGKSWICRDIIRQLSHIPGGLIISPTDKMSSFYGAFFPELYIHYRFDSGLISGLLQRQEEMIEKAKTKEKEGKKLDPSVFFLMDDCMAQKNEWIKDETISEIFMNGRHYRITYMLTMQYSLGIKPELRSNFDYIFILGEDMTSNRKRLYEHYAGMFPTFDVFEKVFDALTENYCCMVIDNKTKSKNLTDKVFWYKSVDIPNDFSIGCKKFKELHDELFDENWKNKKPMFDINTLGKKKKNKANFTVQKV
jgi:hypothetical protein